MSDNDLTITLTQGWLQFEFDISRELSDRLERAVVLTGLMPGEIFELALHDDPYRQASAATDAVDLPDDDPDSLANYEAVRSEWARRMLSHGIDLALENHQTTHIDDSEVL